MSTASICILLLFSLFLVHGVGEVEASRRLYINDRSYEAYHRFKLHNTLMNGVASIDSERPLPKDSESTPLPSVSETFRLLVTSRILSSPPSEVVPAESGGSTRGVSHVVVFVTLSVVLILLIAIGIWLIGFKLRRHEGAECVHNSKGQAAATIANGHGCCHPVRTHPSAPPPMANGRGGGGSVPAQPSAAPPKANGRGGGGSVPAQPSAAPSKANGRGGGGSVPAQPSAVPILNGRAESKPVRNHRPAPPMVNGRGGGGSVPTHRPAPPMVNGRGGGGSVPTNPAPAMAIGRRDRRGGESMRSSMQPRVPTDDPRNASSRPAPMENASSIQLTSRHPTASRVFDTVNPNPRPSRVAEFGLIVFTYEELRVATNNFSKINFLGEGGFAKVFKGSLPRNRTVAVKLLKNENSKAEKEFQNEVGIISRLRHINIVTLIGYCITETRRLIVYEFVENKSLHDHLRGGNGLQVMDWAIRMKIAQGAAKGLQYLHEECGVQNIIHRDVKPANILLDSKFVAKVADFGIAKLCPNSFESYIATYVIGSVGFIDPFYYETKELSFKSDVYSFGVVLLELISGETHLPTVQELKNKLSRALKFSKFETIADPKLENNYNLDEMALMVTCVEACLRKDPMDRPQMIQVARVLEKVIPVDELKMRTRPNRGS